MTFTELMEATRRGPHTAVQLVEDYVFRSGLISPRPWQYVLHSCGANRPEDIAAWPDLIQEAYDWYQAEFGNY